MQPTLHAADPHQLGLLLPHDPLLLYLLVLNDHEDHRPLCLHGRVWRRWVRRRCVSFRGGGHGGTWRRHWGLIAWGEDDTTNGSGDMGREPGIDAINVECVGAPGNKPKHVVVIKIAEMGIRRARRVGDPRSGGGRWRRSCESRRPHAPPLLRACLQIASDCSPRHSTSSSPHLIPSNPFQARSFAAADPP